MGPKVVTQTLGYIIYSAQLALFPLQAYPMFALQFVFTIVFVALLLPCILSMQSEEQTGVGLGRKLVHNPTITMHEVLINSQSHSIGGSCHACSLILVHTIIILESN